MRGRALENPWLRVALSVPVVVLLAYALAVGGVSDPAISVGLLVVGAALAVATLLSSTSGSQGVPVWWQVAATLVGVGLLPVLLVEGLSAPVDLFALLFVLVLVLGAFTYPTSVRLPLICWTLAAWFAALWWDGIRDADLLLLHLGAGALIARTAVGTADDLERAVQGEADAEAVAARRADLLGRMLRVHTLEREEVLEAVLDGLEDVGFAAVSLRVPDGDELVLAAGMGLHGPLAQRIPGDLGMPGLALRSRRIEVVEDRARMDELGVEPDARGTIAVPVTVEDHVEAVVAAVTVDGPVAPHQRETAELLAGLAGRALRRAAVYRADELTVAELQRLESRTQDFVSTVSHELRTPLTVVQGLGQTLRKRWADLDTRRRDDLLRRVAANAGRLADMVRSLLDTSAFEEGRIVVQPHPVELDQVLEDLFHRLASVTAAHPVVTAVPPGLQVRADRSLLEHVLENLLTNIAKHTPQGTRVEIAAREQGEGGVELSIADDGPGIRAADLPHVLDRFYRGGDPVHRPSGGLGLGLALASEILAAHGSDLRVDSDEGHGTRFSFVLPAVLDAPGRTAS
jgi:signal transduction histidine kinase